MFSAVMCVYAGGERVFASFMYTLKRAHVCTSVLSKRAADRRADISSHLPPSAVSQVSILLPHVESQCDNLSC